MKPPPEWTLSYDGFEPARQGLREALCTLGNGNFATRGAAEEACADEIHYPGTYLAGGFNRLQTDIAGRVVENEDLVNLPNWLPLTFRPEGGDWLNVLRDTLLSYRQMLDMRHGILHRELHVRDREGRETAITSRRLVSMHTPDLAAIEMTIRPLNWSGQMDVTTAIDGRVINAGVARYRQLNDKHLRVLETRDAGGDRILLVAETVQSHLRIAEAARTRLWRDGEPFEPERETACEDEHVEQVLRFAVSEGQSLRIEKIVSLHSGRDRAISEPAIAALASVERAGSFADLLDDHALAWKHLWDRCDIELDGPVRIQMILRLHIFHLLQTVSPHTAGLDVGVPARGLHGEAYRGHIFWDEVFILPFLNYRVPDISRALLQYRYRRLPAARRIAAELGHRGATYPWQSGSSGREESQVLHLNPRSGRWTPDNSSLQRHVSLAIAYNIWRYYEASGDLSFLASYGTEMLIEIARFWASIAEPNGHDDRYSIRGIMGSDEFHDQYPWRNEPGIDNNAYSNVMAAWLLAKVPEVLGLIHADRRHELQSELKLDDDELAYWDEVSRKLVVPFHDGVISQFERYDELEEFDWEGYRKKYGNIERLDRILEAEGDNVNRYKASKQADVLMLFYLLPLQTLEYLFRRLGYPFDIDTITRCIRYYIPRTSNGSTLSRVVHSWVLARHDRTRSWELFTEALESDISDIQGGTTAEGIHLGAMAGTVDLIQRGQTALEVRDGVLRLNPCLPQQLKGLRLRLLFRGARLELDINCDRTIVTAPYEWTRPEKIGIAEEVHPFKGGSRLEFVCEESPDGWRPVSSRSVRQVRGRSKRSERGQTSDPGRTAGRA